MQDNTTSAVLIDFDAQNVDTDLLMDWLYTVRHNSGNALTNVDTLTLVKDTLHEFYTFLGPDFESWHKPFIAYSTDLVRFLGRPEWEVIWCVRSIEFTQYTQALLNGQCQEVI